MAIKSKSVRSEVKRISNMMPVINPMGTACWLLDNTSLTFEQIAKFCDLHIMEVSAIANDDNKVRSANPVENMQLTYEEIERCQNDENAVLTRANDPRAVVSQGQKKITRYKLMSHRYLVPCGAKFLLDKYPQFSDQEIAKLVGATKDTVMKIREGSHKGMSGITAKDPVLASLCTRKALDMVLAKYKTDDDI